MHGCSSQGGGDAVDMRDIFSARKDPSGVRGRFPVANGMLVIMRCTTLKFCSSRPSGNDEIGIQFPDPKIGSKDEISIWVDWWVEKDKICQYLEC